MTKNLERKKKEQIQGKRNRKRPIFNPTIQHVIVNLYTKFEVSILNGCGDIFDKKYYGTRTVRKSDYTPASDIPKHMAGILDEKCREKEKYREEQIRKCPFSIPHYNLSLLTCIPNLKLLS